MQLVYMKTFVTSAALLFAGLLGGDVCAQTRQPATMPARPQATAPVSPRPASTDGKVMFEFGKVPTFEDHDREAAAKEAQLPVRFPVLPLFQVSLDLPGYVDPLRRMSMLTFEAVQPELDDAYSHPDQWAEDVAINEYHGAEYADEKTPISITTTTTAAGDQYYLVKYRFFQDGEGWVQWQMLHAEPVEGGGVRMIKVVSHWPAQFAEMCEKEMSYYLDQSQINPVKR